MTSRIWRIKIWNNIAIGSIVLAAFSFFAVANEAGLIHMMPATDDSRWASMWNGFIFGAACGILGLMIVGLVKNIRALKDEKKLKKLYIQENDERQIQIWTSARASAMQAFLILGLVAVIVAGYFHMTVNITILACVVAQSLLGIGFKLFYTTKY